MTSHDRPRTDPIAAHVYTMPVVRELPRGAGAPVASVDPHGVPQPVVHAADAHAW
jgi:hypothetical protein